ncbi:replication protein A 70 kDa DNA-binding subunit D-like [Arachis stenosperma]|uniref:replication protein A 70 kDa DNA-binding subunit D-like n=1 Tax=Arachis stenosperma TaxID=217475 RepID=UPI0025AB9DAE|nr:replication protein A 70 kDa DNA-binding subunit D-like [Arachis stenosperma]
MSQTFDYLADLNARKLQWNFKVYVIRVWELPNRYNEGEVGTIEVIIEDSQGTRLQVSIPKSLVSKWRGVLVQFQMYIMTNFIVVDNQKGNISRGKYLLFFSHRTIVSHVENPSFPLNAFRFRTIRELLNAEKIDDSALFDMIGKVVGKEDPKELITSKGKETKRLAVILEDLENNRIGCTIFGEMVDQLLRHMQDGRVEPLIVVVQYFKATRWNGKTSVQSHFDISQLHIDSNLKDVAEFRSRLLGGEPSSSVRISQEGPAWIAASIVAINVTKDDWFYKSCRKCPKKVETPIGNRYECRKCGHTHGSAALRFKVEVMVFDGTGSIRLLLWDKETTRVKCFICVQVIVGDEYPKTLDNMMEKRVLFKINIKEANINQFDHVYTVMKICDDEDIIDKNLPKELSTNLPSNVSEDGCNNYLEISENVANLKTDCDTESSMDVVEECISSLKYKTPSKNITNGLKNSPLSLNEDEEEGQLSTNRFSRKMGKRQKCVNLDADI